MHHADQQKIFHNFPQANQNSKPWIPLNKIYNESDQYSNFNTELNDLYEWLLPTNAENHLRKLTIIRYINFIEAILPNSYVVLQGSSSTDTFLSDNDIDLIVFFENTSSNSISKIANIPKYQCKDTELPTINSLNPQTSKSQFDTNFEPSFVLENIAFQLMKSKMAKDIKIIKTARVPIIKAQDKEFEFDIDICVSNFDGVITANRLLKCFSKSKENEDSIISKDHIMKGITDPDTLKKLIFILKIFIHSNKLESPFEGGFGSIELVHFALFLMMIHPGETNLAKLLLSFFDLIGRQMNFFLCSLSIESNFPHFISKIHHSLLDKQVPQSLIFQDWTGSSDFLGTRTKKTIELSHLCNRALNILNNVTNNGFPEYSTSCNSVCIKNKGTIVNSLVSYILPNLESYIKIRNKQEDHYRMLFEHVEIKHNMKFNIQSKLHKDGSTSQFETNSYIRSSSFSFLNNYPESGFSRIQKKLNHFDRHETFSQQLDKSPQGTAEMKHVNKSQSFSLLTNKQNEKDGNIWSKLIEKKTGIKHNLPYRR